MTPPAAAYARITREVQALIAANSDNDLDRAAYMVARAALLTVRGRRDAASKAYALADELATEGRP